MENNNLTDQNIEAATLGGGCFWCLEAVFKQVEGVVAIESGYAGGQVQNPSYKAVCTGSTGHAEVIKVSFDPSVITYTDILTIFWHVHDPTTKNRQGNDVGTQYRSAIYYHNETQKATAEKSLKEYETSDLWAGKYTTEITEINNYFPAERYHQDYFELNPNQPYCVAVVSPKVQKFKKKFKDQLKG